MDARNDNVKLARKLYIEMQRQALAVSEVREPARPYAPEPEQRRAAEQDHRHSGLSVHADTPAIVAASAGVFIPSEWWGRSLL